MLRGQEAEADIFRVSFGEPGDNFASRRQWMSKEVVVGPGSGIYRAIPTPWRPELFDRGTHPGRSAWPWHFHIPFIGDGSPLRQPWRHARTGDPTLVTEERFPPYSGSWRNGDARGGDWGRGEVGEAALSTSAFAGPDSPNEELP